MTLIKNWFRKIFIKPVKLNNQFPMVTPKEVMPFDFQLKDTDGF